MVAHRALDQPLGVGGGEPVLGLADEFRLADEAGDQRAGVGDEIVAGDVARPCGCCASSP